jgi:hypothetical protein
MLQNHLIWPFLDESIKLLFERFNESSRSSYLWHMRVDIEVIRALSLQATGVVKVS